VPLYNSVSLIGGIIGPYVTGAVVAKYGGFLVVSIIMGSMLCAGSILVLILKSVHLRHGAIALAAVLEASWIGKVHRTCCRSSATAVALRPVSRRNAVGTPVPGTASARARTSVSHLNNCDEPQLLAQVNGSL